VKVTKKRFRIAFSFAGEKREFVAQIAANLARHFGEEAILYDKYHEPEFGRARLGRYLPKLYHEETDLIVVIICRDYALKEWPGLEWDAIFDLLKKRKEDEVMLCRFDHATVEGLFDAGYVELDQKTPAQAASAILQRLAGNEGNDREFYITGRGSTLWKRSNSGTKQLPSTENSIQDSRRSVNQPAFHGLQRKALYEKLQGPWLCNGPCVAILQGFPGCGKTQLASALASKDRIVLDPISVELGSSDPSLDLLLDLAATLQDHGIGELNAEIDKGESGDLYDALLKVLRRERILIIVDEFQCVLDDANAQPPPQWQKLIESLNNSARAEGRLLLISNRSISIARWSEKCPIHEIKGFSIHEAATFLAQLLEEKGLASRVPTERLEELGRRLGGNPRAIRTLVGSLKSDALEDLLPSIPSLESIGDVVLAKELLDKFERDLIARTIPNLGDDVASFMRWLAVNRRPITKGYYAELTKIFKDSKALRANLFDRFFLELTQSGDQMHPLAREVCVTRLRLANPEWTKAHSLAADYHLQAFRSSQASPVRHVAASFSELRHHLVESGRTGELYNASVRMTKFVLSRIPKPKHSKIPHTIESLEEHIALISALPEGEREPGLEYHLALCLKQRNTGNDYKNALSHVRKAARADSYYAVWLLLIELEYEINGVAAMRAAMNKALRFLGNGSNVSAVYRACANLLDKAGRPEEAINLLESAASTPGLAGVASLVSLCSSLLQRDGDNERAIRLLKTIANKTDVQEIGLVYRHWASVLMEQNLLDDAVELLDRAIHTPGMTKLHSLYVLKAEGLAKSGSDIKAINALFEGIEDTRVFDAGPIYCKCAELLVANSRIEDAIQTMERGIESKAIKDPLPLYHALAGILEKTGQPDEGVRLLKGAIANRWLRREPSLYLVCSKLLFHQKKLDQAITILDQGLDMPKLAERNLLIQMKADFTARMGRTEEAINILKAAVTSDRNPHHLEFLYCDCAELMAKTGKLTDAIEFLRTGAGSPAIGNKSILYRLCAKLLVKEGQPSEAIELLKNALTSPGITGTVILYQASAKILVKEGRLGEAVELLMGGIRGSKVGNMGSLYQACAEILITKGQRAQAIALLKEGMIEYPKDQGVKDLHKKVVGGFCRPT
jgi:tetratricopeptide (TPR) repeat protein